MNIRVTKIDVDTEAITPTLNLGVEVTYYQPLEIPLFISGKLGTADGKTIAYLNEFQINSDSKIKIYAVHSKSKEQIFASGNKHQYNYYAIITSVLSPQAIDHIETVREKDPEKSVHFSINFILKLLEFPSEPVEQPLIQLKTLRNHDSFTIKQSDWVKKYSPLLGIGNFLLLELEIPDKHRVKANWTELYDRLSHRLKEMEDAIRQGDWQKTMDRSRQFYESLKIGDGKDGHKKFEQELRKLFKKDQHTDESIQNFLDSIWKFFEYNSKFVHDKDKEGNLKLIPITTKEDAYFAYALGVGLLNIIGRKVRKE